MKKQLQKLLVQILDQMGIKDIVPEVVQTADLKNGDYTTNVAMVLAKQMQRKPLEIAKEIVKQLELKTLNFKLEEPQHSTDQSGQKVSGSAKQNQVLQDIEKIEIAAPGFINFFLSASALSNQLSRVIREEEGYGTLKSLQSAVGSGQKEYSKSNKPQTANRKPQTRKIMVEFAHPNTHKAFHIGHLRNITTGESIVRLLESQGIEVIRANYQGDIGMHIAKALYGMTMLLGKQIKAEDNLEDLSLIQEKIQKLAQKSLSERMDFLGKAYVFGSKLFEESALAKTAISQINKCIYVRGKLPGFEKYYEAYKITRHWSLDYFESIYKRVDSHFDHYYFESEVAESGKRNTFTGLKKEIFVKSKGAIIFPGEKYALHNRVFITQEGNPTYEAKDMGLGPLQFAEYQPELIIHVVGPEQTGYFQVVFEALAQLFPETRGKEYHLIYGWVRLKKGKMSSRLGNVVLGEWLLDEVKKAVYNILQTSASKYTKVEQEQIAETAAVAAVKYSFLKVSTKQEIAFDIEESVNLNGDSGPYLLYTYARARSVLRKATSSTLSFRSGLAGEKSPTELNKPMGSLSAFEMTKINELNAEEKLVVRLIYRFPEIVGEAAANYAPNQLCKYLYDLASAFNTFYNKHSILGGAKEVHSSQSAVRSLDENMTRDALIPDTTSFRLALTATTAQVLKNGLYLLGIQTLERM